MLGAFLAEAQAVCVGQPVLLVGDLNADPGTIPCLAKRNVAVQLVDLALACSVGSGVELDMTCKLNLEECTASTRDFVVACPNALAASSSFRVFVGGRFSPDCSDLSEFHVKRWTGGGFLSTSHPAYLAYLLVGYSGQVCYFGNQGGSGYLGGVLR